MYQGPKSTFQKQICDEKILYLVGLISPLESFSKFLVAEKYMTLQGRYPKKISCRRMEVLKLKQIGVSQRSATQQNVKLHIKKMNFFVDEYTFFIKDFLNAYKKSYE